MSSKQYSYNDFWEMRGRQSIWFTRNIGYRIGALIAWLCSRVGITPNTISIISGSITVISALLALYLGTGHFVGCMILILGLQIGFAFDCADGPLARATGQGSSFGSIFDKMADLSSGILMPSILAYGSGGYEWEIGGSARDISLVLLALFLTAKSVLCVSMWLKEEIMHRTDRLREDNRNHGWWWKIKKTASLSIDEPIYRLLIAISWSVGVFWEFVIFYGAVVWVITILYIVSSKREMDEMDKSSR